MNTNDHNLLLLAQDYADPPSRFYRRLSADITGAEPFFRKQKTGDIDLVEYFR